MTTVSHKDSLLVIPASQVVTPASQDVGIITPPLEEGNGSNPNLNGVDGSNSVDKVSISVVADKEYSVEQLKDLGLPPKIAELLISLWPHNNEGETPSISGAKLLELVTIGDLTLDKVAGGGDELNVNVDESDGYSFLHILQVTDLTTSQALNLVMKYGENESLNQVNFDTFIDEWGNLRPGAEVALEESQQKYTVVSPSEPENSSQTHLENNSKDDPKKNYEQYELISLGLHFEEAKWLVNTHGENGKVSSADLKKKTTINSNGEYELTTEAHSLFVSAVVSSILEIKQYGFAFLINHGLSADEADFLLVTYGDPETSVLSSKTYTDLLKAGVLKADYDSAPIEQIPDSSPPKDPSATLSLVKINKTVISLEEAMRIVSSLDGAKNSETILFNVPTEGTAQDGSEASVFHPTSADAQWLNIKYGGGDGLNAEEVAVAVADGVVQIEGQEILMTLYGKSLVYEDNKPTAGSIEKQLDMLPSALLQLRGNASGTNRSLTQFQLQADFNGLSPAAAAFLINKFSDSSAEPPTISKNQLEDAIQRGSVVLSQESGGAGQKSRYTFTITDREFVEPSKTNSSGNTESSADDSSFSGPNPSKEQQFYAKNRHHFMVLFDMFRQLGGKDHLFSRRNLYDLLKGNDITDDQRRAIEFMLSNEAGTTYDQMDSQQTQDKTDGAISLRDITNWLTEHKIFHHFEQNEASNALSIANNNFVKWAQSNGRLSTKDLEEVTQANGHSKEEEEAAQFLLKNQDLLFYILTFENDGKKSKFDHDAHGAYQSYFHNLPARNSNNESSVEFRTKQQLFFDDHKHEFHAITAFWPNWIRGNTTVSRAEIEAIANSKDGEGYAQGEINAAQMLINNPWLFDELDTAKTGKGKDNLISTHDLQSWFQKNGIFVKFENDNKAKIDLVEEFYNQWNNNNEYVSIERLNRIARTGKTADERDAAQFLLDNRAFMLYLSSFNEKSKKRTFKDDGSWLYRNNYFDNR